MWTLLQPCEAAKWWNPPSANEDEWKLKITHTPWYNPVKVKISRREPAHSAVEPLVFTLSKQTVMSALISSPLLRSCARSLGSVNGFKHGKIWKLCSTSSLQWFRWVDVLQNGNTVLPVNGPKKIMFYKKKWKTNHLTEIHVRYLDFNLIRGHLSCNWMILLSFINHSW